MARVRLSFIALLLLIGLAAPTGSAAPGGIVLQFPTWQQDEPGTSKWWKDQITAFERVHPEVRIEFTKVPLSEHTDKLITQFAGGSPAQIVHLPALTFFTFAERGWLEPLDSRLAQTDVPKTYHSLQRTCVWKGTTYCVLLFHDAYAFVYNEKLLKEAGKSVPTDPQSYLDTLKALTDKQKGKYGIGLVTLPGFNLVAFLSVFVIGAGGHWTDRNGNPSVVTPEVIQGFKWWKEAATAATPPGEESGRLRQLFIQGKIATFNDGPWMQGFVEKAAPDVRPYLRAAQLPFKFTMGEASDVIAIPKQIPEQQKELVWEFIKSGTTKEAQARYAAVECAGPPRVDVAVPPEAKKDCPFLDAYVESAKRGVDWLPTGLETKTNEFIKIVSDHAQRIIVQNEPVETVLQDLQKALESLKKQ